MKSLQTKTLLLDSNAYFRLADNLYPLLSTPFGETETYILRILGGTIGEYNWQNRLQTKFDWFGDSRHILDRHKGLLSIEPKFVSTIDNTFTFILSDSRSRSLLCSPFDIRCLATAYELKLILVTDDLPLHRLSDEFEVTCYSSLELMHLMHQEHRITMKEVHDTVYLWHYMLDLPRNFYKSFVALFNTEPNPPG